MKVAVFRHAEKQTDWSSDPSLSSFGEDQAQRLREEVKVGRLIQPEVLLTSPKKRAQATFLPISRHFKIPIRTEVDLDERRNGESSAQFRKRIQDFLQGLAKDPSQNVFMCSHLDWLEEFTTVVPSDTDLSQLQDFYWSPASYLIFDVRDIWHLEGKGRFS